MLFDKRRHDIYEMLHSISIYWIITIYKLKILYLIFYMIR